MQARVKHNLSKWLSLPKLPPVKSSGQSNVKLKFYGYSLSELKQLEVDHEQDSTIILFSNEDRLVVAHTFVPKALLWPVTLRCTKMAIVGPNTLANTGLRVDSRTASISSPWHYLAVPATRMMQLGGFPGMLIYRRQAEVCGSCCEYKGKRRRFRAWVANCKKERKGSFAD